MSSTQAAGTVAPNFTLRVTPDQNLTRSDLRGKPVIRAFYPVDWSPVCGDQMTLYNEILPELRKHDAELLGISVEGVWCHAAFARDRHCISRCSPISNPRGTSRGNTAPIAQERASASAHYLSSIDRHHRVELLLSDRCQSRRRRNS